jgi:site-specific recombinase XerD
MDWSAFEEFMLLEKRYSRVTVRERRKSLRQAAEMGFNAATADAAACRSHLARIVMAGKSENAYNHTCKALKVLLEFKQLDPKQLHLRKQARSKYRFLSPDQVKKCLDYRHKDPETERFRRALLLWGLKSAMRLSEVAAMDVQDLDKAQSRFHVRKPAKRGAHRWLPLEPWVFSPKRALGAYLAHRKEPAGDERALWVTDHHGSQGAQMPRRATAAGLARVLQECSKELGFTVNFTVTRHTRATELRRLGWDLVAIQYYLGHARSSSTAIYAGITPEDMVNIMGRLGSRDPFHAGRP